MAATRCYLQARQQANCVLTGSSNCHKQGKDAVPFLEGLVVGDVAGIPNGSGSLSVFTNEKGGIIDDTVITKVPSRFLSAFILGIRTSHDPLASCWLVMHRGYDHACRPGRTGPHGLWPCAGGR